MQCLFRPLQLLPRVFTRGVKIDASLKEKLKGKLIFYKPRTPGLRHRVDIDRSELWKGKPVRELTRALRKTGGRNNTGRITVRHRGGGHKRRYRIIDFKRSVVDTPATVQRLEYDPNRTCHLALLSYGDGSAAYMLAPQDLQPGDTVMASRTKEVEVRVGNSMKLEYIPLGSIIHNVELTPGKGGQIARAAGTSCEVLDKNSKPGFATLRLSSKEHRLISLQCLATIGSLTNPFHKLQKLGKAGRSRHRGRRPSVRGVAMNPVDHPMGGGEGKSHGGRHSCSPEGLLSKGFKTRDRNKKSSKFIVMTRKGRNTGQVQSLS